MTQEALARATGLGLSAVSKLVEQRGIDPSWTTVQRLAKVLGVSVLKFVDADLMPAEPATDRARGRPRKRK
jgi:transcriptional regulator with XRE-family HTH domain